MTLSRSHYTFARAVRDNPLQHHLWRNGSRKRVWWVHYVSFPTPATKQRVRHSLGTTDVVEARRKRDAIFAALA